MKTERYFEKNGFVYGVSVKYEFGRWTGYVVKFTDLSKAYDWLHTEEHDFRDRSLVSKTMAKRLLRDYPEIVTAETGIRSLSAGG